MHMAYICICFTYDICFMFQYSDMNCWWCHHVSQEPREPPPASAAAAAAAEAAAAAAWLGAPKIRGLVAGC